MWKYKCEWFRFGDFLEPVACKVSDVRRRIYWFVCTPVLACTIMLMPIHLQELGFCSDWCCNDFWFSRHMFEHGASALIIEDNWGEAWRVFEGHKQVIGNVFIDSAIAPRIVNCTCTLFKHVQKLLHYRLCIVKQKTCTNQSLLKCLGFPWNNSLGFSSHI